MKKKLFIAGMSFVIALILLATASFAWFTFSANPEVSGMQLAIYTDSTLLLASDVNGEPGEFRQYISLSDSFTGLAPLRPVSTADGINWFLPAYDEETGCLAPVSEFILDNTLEHANVKVTDENGNELSGDAYEGQQRKGYYVYTDLWMKTEDDYANVRLSVPHFYGTAEERQSGDAEASGLSSTELNQAVYGTYVLGEPELDAADADDPQLADRVTQPETAIRVGFLVYQDKKTLETGNKGKTLPFTIYEPNADKRAGSTGMTSEYVVPDENGDVTNTKQSYISGYTPETEVVAEGNYVITQPIALGKDGKAKLGSVAPENLIVQNASEWDETETIKTLSGQRAGGNTRPSSNDIAEFGQFLKTDERFVLSDENGQRTALRIGNGGDVQTDIAGSHVIVTLKKDTPVRVRIFIWIEGQDVDCWNDIAAGTFRVNLELAGESLVRRPVLKEVVRGTLKGYGRSDDPSSGWFDSTAAGIQRTAITALEFTDEVPEGYSATWNAGTDSGDDAINAYLVGTKVYIVVPEGADAVYLPANSDMLFYNMRSCTVISGLDMTDTSNVTDMDWMFLGNEKLARLDVSGFDTSNVTGMYQMFKGCKALTVLDVSGFHTEKVRNMEGLFQNCEKLTSLDVSGFDTSSVTTMYDMFYYCKGLTSLDVSGFNTSKVTTMAGMFYGCYGLTSLDVTGFDTSNVTSMSMLFQSCGKLTSIDLSGFDTSKVRSMDYMFSGCSGLTSLDVSPLDTSRVYSMKHMFSSLNLTSLDLSSMDTSAVTCMTGMFQYCKNLTSLDLSNFNTSKVWGMDWMFYGCESLETLDLSGFDTSKVKTMEYMFEHCESLTSLDVTGFDTSKVTDMSYMFASCRSLTSLDVSGFDTALVEDFRGTFMRCTNLTTIYAGSGWSLASRKVGPGAYWTTFEDSTRLVGGNGTAFSTAHDDYDYARIDTAETPGYFTAKDTSQTLVTRGTLKGSGSSNWYDASAAGITKFNITELVFTKTVPAGYTASWNAGTDEDPVMAYRKDKTVSVVVPEGADRIYLPASCNYIFSYMVRLETISGLDLLDTSNVTDMSYMFASNSSMTSVDVRSFDTSNVTTMQGMFVGCRELASLDLSGFDTSNVTVLRSLVSDCDELITVDISSFDTADVTDMMCMFAACPELRTIYAGSGWSTAAVTDSPGMFTECTKLTGGNGTGYNSSHIDASYARIDTAETPGYFTAKSN